MNSGDNPRIQEWRRFSADVLMIAATLGLAAAAVGMVADVLYLLMALGAMLGLAVLLEPSQERFGFDRHTAMGFDTARFDTVRLVDSLS